MNNSRIYNSVKNFIYGSFSQIIILVVNFIVRIVFIRCLGKNYLGVNGLFSNILTILSLAEMGFGTAITYNLYEPIAKKNYPLIISLMDFYKKVYSLIGVFVAVVGLLILPFINYIISDSKGISNIHLIYFLFLMDTVSSYFFAYKRSLLNADQKAYICSQYRFIFVFFKGIFQILFLIVTKYFVVYLLIQIIFTFFENVFLSIKVDKLYPFLKKMQHKKLTNDNIDRIKKDVHALVISKIASVSLNGTDNIIISAFTSIGNVGILSNYTLISGSLTMIVSQVTSAITGSVGNFIACEKKEQLLNLFKRIDYLYFNIYAFCFICMFNIYNPFISVFFGENLIFNDFIVFIFCLNYLIEGILQSLWMFRTTMGLFVQGKYRPIFSAIINIFFSILFAKKFGVFGVLLGTTISRVFVNLWYDPYIIFKFGLNVSPKIYFKAAILRFFPVLFIALTLHFFKYYLFPEKYNFLYLILLIVFTVLISIIGLLVFSYRSEEFKYYKELLTKKFLKR